MVAFPSAASCERQPQEPKRLAYQRPVCGIIVNHQHSQTFQVGQALRPLALGVWAVFQIQQ